MSRRWAVVAWMVLVVSCGLVGPVLAQQAGVTTPPVYRFKVGTIEITAIADGTLPLDLALLPETKKDPAATARLAQQAAVSSPIPTYVNTYAINTGDRLVIVDTGTGLSKDFGPDLGRFTKNLAAAGINPADVDMVFLTHLHPDHVGAARDLADALLDLGLARLPAEPAQLVQLDRAVSRAVA